MWTCIINHRTTTDKAKRPRSRLVVGLKNYVQRMQDIMKCPFRCRNLTITIMLLAKLESPTTPIDIIGIS